MSSYKLLYNAIKSIIPNSYSIKFNDVVEFTIDKFNRCIPTTKTVGIYFKDAGNGKRLVDSGKYASESVRVVFNVYGDNSVSGIEDALDYCEIVISLLDSVINFSYAKDNEIVHIQDCSRQGNINYLGKNKQGIPVYSINYVIKYSKGDED